MRKNHPLSLADILVYQGLAHDIHRARALIMARKGKVDGHAALYPGQIPPANANITIEEVQVVIITHY